MEFSAAMSAVMKRGQAAGSAKSSTQSVYRHGVLAPRKYKCHIRRGKGGTLAKHRSPPQSFVFSAIGDR